MVSKRSDEETLGQCKFITKGFGRRIQELGWEDGSSMFGCSGEGGGWGRCLDGEEDMFKFGRMVSMIESRQGMINWEDCAGELEGMCGSWPGTSHVGGALGSKRMVVPGRRSASWSLRCSMKVTWKELKMAPVVLSQRWYALEWGAYPIKVQGVEWRNILGLDVCMREKARHPISRRWLRDGTVPNQISWGVFPTIEEEAVRLVRYAAVVQNLSHREAGVLQANHMERALLRIVRCRHLARLFWADV